MCVAVDRVQLLRSGEALDRFTAEVGRDDHQQRTGRDQVDERIRVILREPVDAAEQPPIR